MSDEPEARSTEPANQLPKRKLGPKKKALAKKPTPAVLRRELRRLARNFADDVVALLEEQGMWDEPPADDDDSRRVRRSPGDMQEVMAAILAELQGCKEPVSIGFIAAALETTSRQITHPMSLLVDEGKVVRSGERRGARYRVKRRKRATKARKR